MKTKYYRGKFMIAVYSLLREGETLLALCDNTSEFAELTKTNKNSASNCLSKLFLKKTNYIIFNGKIRNVVFIKVDEDE